MGASAEPHQDRTWLEGTHKPLAVVEQMWIIFARRVHRLTVKPSEWFATQLQIIVTSCVICAAFSYKVRGASTQSPPPPPPSPPPRPPPRPLSPPYQPPQPFQPHLARWIRSWSYRTRSSCCCSLFRATLSCSTTSSFRPSISTSGHYSSPNARGVRIRTWAGWEGSAETKLPTTNRPLRRQFRLASLS